MDLHADSSVRKFVSRTRDHPEFDHVAATDNKFANIAAYEATQNS